MDEEMKKRIRESAEGLELPESLCPEQIEAMLSEKTRKKPVPIFRFAAAAVLVILLAPAVYMGTSLKNRGEGDNIPLMGAPVEEETSPAAGLDTFRIMAVSGLKAAENMEELQARVDAAYTDKQTKNSETQSAAGLMAARAETDYGSRMKVEQRENYSSAGPIGLSGDTLWFYHKGNGLTAVETDEGRLKQVGSIPDQEEGEVTALYAADDSLLVARQRGRELLTQLYGQKAEGEPWKEVWRAVSEGELESVEYDGAYFYVTMRCYPEAGEEERAFLPMAGGRLLNCGEIYLPDDTANENQYRAAFSVNRENPAQPGTAAAVFGGEETTELVFSTGNILAQPAALEDDSEPPEGFAVRTAQMDGQPALQISFEAPGLTKIQKQSAVLTLYDFTLGPGRIIPYGNEYAAVPAISSEGDSVYLLVSWNEAVGLGLERVIRTEGEVRAILCSEGYSYLLTDDKLVCYNRTACGAAGSLEVVR